MTEIQDVTGTAFIVAEYRARENAEADPLYGDQIVPLFLDERTRRAADRMAADFPAGEKVVKLRTRYYDDRLDEQLSRGCRQVVILGAGLDTRAVRKQSPGVTYFEIDDADTVSFKQARLAEAGVEAPIVFIPGNYITDGLPWLLAANGFDFDMPTYVIWEGNTMYLSRPSILEVLTDLRRRVSHFAISFDYMTEAVIAHATGDERTIAFVRRFAAMGAPWHFGVNDLEALAGEAGLTVMDKVKTAELHRAYWPNRPLDASFYEHYSLCTLTPHSVR
jgi:methyltransferase (TIGR00027 family)